MILVILTCLCCLLPLSAVLSARCGEVLGDERFLNTRAAALRAALAFGAKLPGVSSRTSFGLSTLEQEPWGIFGRASAVPLSPASLSHGTNANAASLTRSRKLRPRQFGSPGSATFRSLTPPLALA